MKAMITLENQKTYEADVFKDINNLIITFNDAACVPWDVVRTRKFTVEVKPTDEEIGCCNNCDICLTPIC